MWMVWCEGGKGGELKYVSHSAEARDLASVADLVVGGRAVVRATCGGVGRRAARGRAVYRAGEAASRLHAAGSGAACCGLRGESSNRAVTAVVEMFMLGVVEGDWRWRRGARHVE